MYGTLEVGNHSIKNLKGSKYFKESNHRNKQKIEKDYIIEQMKLKQQAKKGQDEKVQAI
jgi:hypothetical protein